ncbi:MAG: hypothetical protein J7K78_01585 [Thaumarchaeota archaeon]|nr:hypothetical protein [Nitrososphaerota archaeon]
MKLKYENYGKNDNSYVSEARLRNGARAEAMKMLSQEFFEVWIVGEVDDQLIEKLKEKLHEACGKSHRRIRFRFYSNNPRSNLAYLDAMRSVLLENTALSIVIEERGIEDLEKDSEHLKDEAILLVRGRGGLLEKLPKARMLRIEEV